MCHFELAALEAGRLGRSIVQPPPIEPTGAARAYVITWMEGGRS